ncbi:MAG: hypothetical protein ABIJ39_11180 [Chloroflexota bacterium]
MSRIIKTENAGNERNRLAKGVILAVRHLGQKTAPDAESRDLVAYMVLALTAIAGSIESSVSAWEKRGYWIKADKFRLEWDWTQPSADKLAQDIDAENWDSIAETAINISQRLAKVQISPNHRLGRPWTGAWEALQKKRE